MWQEAQMGHRCFMWCTNQNNKLHHSIYLHSASWRRILLFKRSHSVWICPVCVAVMSAIHVHLWKALWNWRKRENKRLAVITLSSHIKKRNEKSSGPANVLLLKLTTSVSFLKCCNAVIATRWGLEPDGHLLGCGMKPMQASGGIWAQDIPAVLRRTGKPFPVDERRLWPSKSISTRLENHFYHFLPLTILRFGGLRHLRLVPGDPAGLLWRGRWSGEDSAEGGGLLVESFMWNWNTIRSPENQPR